MKQRFVRLLVEGADLPEECLPGEPIVELYGESRVLIEHHGGITEYGNERIQVRVRYGFLCICGSGLRLCRMQGPQLVIMGRIDSVTLQRRKDT